MMTLGVLEELTKQGVDDNVREAKVGFGGVKWATSYQGSYTSLALVPCGVDDPKRLTLEGLQTLLRSLRGTPLCGHRDTDTVTINHKTPVYLAKPNTEGEKLTHALLLPEELIIYTRASARETELAKSSEAIISEACGIVNAGALGLRLLGVYRDARSAPRSVGFVVQNRETLDKQRITLRTYEGMDEENAAITSLNDVMSLSAHFKTSLLKV